MRSIDVVARYLFDLRGYTVLPNAISAEEIQAINGWVDRLDLESRPIGDWEGDVEIHSYCACLCRAGCSAPLITSATYRTHTVGTH